MNRSCGTLRDLGADFICEAGVASQTAHETTRLKTCQGSVKAPAAHAAGALSPRARRRSPFAIRFVERGLGHFCVAVVSVCAPVPLGDACPPDVGALPPAFVPVLGLDDAQLVADSASVPNTNASSVHSLNLFMAWVSRYLAEHSGRRLAAREVSCEYACGPVILPTTRTPLGWPCPILPWPSGAVSRKLPPAWDGASLPERRARAW